MQSNMPVNAERNFRKALEMEGADTSAADFLSAVLAQQGREHEVPQVWRDLLARDASNAEVHAKLGVALINNNKAEEGEKVFENALETLDDKTLIKRFYAPYLTNKEDYDRAMDFYEDALDASPNDVPTLMEYAQTLERAGREFEVPEVLKRVLNSDPDPDVRAQVQARLIELEQPKRAATVEAARERMENGDFHAALRELKPLRNWLSDYWKLWALLSSANNRVGQFDEAEESARRLIEMYPGCEPAYGELVNALHGQHRDEEAYTFMNEVAQRNPQSLAIHINLGLAAARAGHKDHAQALAKSIREAVGQNQELEGILEEMAR
jgi:tetratricopeptide (TPR) repeat protein